MNNFSEQLKRSLLKRAGAIAQNFFGLGVWEKSQDWDILILLDGCRADTFRKINFIQGSLSTATSLSTCTPEWSKLAAMKRREGCAYVSSNPFVSEFMYQKWGLKQPFDHLEEVWDWGWDEKLKTVRPETVSLAGKKLLNRFPNKKLILHYMQPHHPFIGKTKIGEDGWQGVRDGVVNGKNQKNLNIYEKLEQGHISREEVMEAYEDNLRYVLSEVKRFLFSLGPEYSGKRVWITSDHGDCFGEYGVYAHPEKYPLPQLIRVPLLKLRLA